LPAQSDKNATHNFAPQLTALSPKGEDVFSGVFFGKSSAPALNRVPLGKNPGAPICSLPGNHTLIVAPTCTGKGTRVIVPTLLKSRQSSCLAIDPKGESAAITARARAEFSHVHVINPWGELGPTFEALGFPPATYNPLDILDRSDPNAVAIAQAMAGAICPREKSGMDSYWSEAAASLLTAVLLWITDQPGETKTLARVLEIVAHTGATLKQYLVKMGASTAFGGAIRENATSFIDLPPETFSGVMSRLGLYTRFLSDPQVKAATAKSSFSMGDLTGEGMDRPTTVYLAIPPGRIASQNTWLRLMIAAGMHTFRRKSPGEGLRCMVLIDGLADLGRLEDLSRDIPWMGGYGVDFTLTVQSLDQLKDLYGDDHVAILGNCEYQWFCKVNDLTSAKYLSGILGHKIPDEVLNLGRDTAILLAPNSLPHYLRTVDYWDFPDAFSMFQKARPDLFWPLKFDPNPYIKS
jgi:type IV secretion system protein VirD4